jgi:hypothetical protein
MLAEMATVGSIRCAGGNDIVLDGDGLDSCTLSSTQQVGPFPLSAETVVKFTSGRLDRFDMPPDGPPVVVSAIAVPAGSVVQLCAEAWEASYLEVPEDRYVNIAGVKLTGRINLDCGKFRYGTLFEDTALSGRNLPRGSSISAEDLPDPH